MDSDTPLTTGGGSAIGATFFSEEQTHQAVSNLKKAGFAGREIKVAPAGNSLIVLAGERTADAERVLREAGGTVSREMTDEEILAASEKIQVSPSARSTVSVIESAEQGVPPVASQPHAGDNDKSGRLIS